MDSPRTWSVVAARRQLTALAAVGLVLSAGCKRDDPCDGAACGTSAIVPFEASPPQGASEPPTFEALLDQDAPIRSATFIIDEGDDRLFVGDVDILMPPGALPVGSRVELHLYRAPVSPGDSVGDILRIDSDVQPAVPLTVVMPMPAGWDGVSTDAYVQWTATGDWIPEPIDAVVDVATGTLSVEISHFSAGAAHLILGADPVTPVSRIVDVPRYEQGNTENCWATVLTMLLNAYGAPVDPWDVNQFFGISVEHGLPFHQFMYAGTIERFIQGWVPGAEVERRVWVPLFGESEDLRQYLVSTLGAGRPTMLHANGWVQPEDWEKANPEAGAHMLLFVGIDGDRFIYHDPQGHGFQEITFPRLLEMLESLGFDQTGTLSLRAPPDESAMASASLVVPDARDQFQTGLMFLPRRESGGLGGSESKVFRWYLSELGREGTADDSGEPAAADLDLVMLSQVSVINNRHQTASRSFDVGFDVYDAYDELVHEQPTVRSAASSPTELGGAVNFGEIDLIDVVREPGLHTFRFYVVDDGEVQDDAPVEIQVGEPDFPWCPPTQTLHDGEIWTLDPEHFTKAGEVEDLSTVTLCNPEEPSPINQCYYGTRFTCTYVHPTIDDEFSWFVAIAEEDKLEPGYTCADAAERRVALDDAFSPTDCAEKPCGVGSSSHYVFVNGFITLGPGYFGSDADLAYYEDLAGAARRYISVIEHRAQRCDQHPEQP